MCCGASSSSARAQTARCPPRCRHLPFIIIISLYSSILPVHRPFVRTVSHVTKLTEVAGKPAAVRRLLLRFVCPPQFCNVRERCDAVLLQLYMAVVIFLGDLQSGSPGPAYGSNNVTYSKLQTPSKVEPRGQGCTQGAPIIPEKAQRFPSMFKCAGRKERLAAQALAMLQHHRYACAAALCMR